MCDRCARLQSRISAGVATCLMAAAIVACGTVSAGHKSAAVSAGATQSQGQSPSSASPPIEPSPTVASDTRLPTPSPVAPAPFPTCKLPFVVAGNPPSPLQGGFVTAPSGQFTADPNGTLTDAYQGTPVTVTSPILHGSFSRPDASYDTTVQRWLPVSRDLVRSDGLAYAYAEAYKVNATDQFESRTHIHVVSLPSGDDTIVYSGGPYDVIAWEPDGLYLVAVGYYHGEGSTGLWRLDPGSGALTKLYGSMYFASISGGIGWVLNAGITPSTLSRVDLAAGTTQVWVNTGDQGWITYMGDDRSGHPFVNIQRFGRLPSQLMVYSAPQQGTVLGSFATWYAYSATDAHGTWFGGQDGIYLYSGDAGLRKVSSTGQGFAAGPCQ